MNIIGNKVTLRAIEENDLPFFHTWGNDPELWQLLGGWHFPSSIASTRTWIEKIQNDQLNLRLAITTKEDGLIGLANLLEIDWKNRHAFHGMMIGNPNIRGKGIGYDVVMSIMRYAFNELGLARLDGSMVESNKTSISFYCNKCGWKEEGRQRHWYYRNGQYWDRILVGITREDYDVLVQKTKYWSE